MSGQDETDLLAAEYVLGTLDAERMREVARQAETDAALASAILAWQDRLAPLADLVQPAPEPPGLWEAIETRLPAARPARAGTARQAALPGPFPGSLAVSLPGSLPARRRRPGRLSRLWNSAAVWRLATVAASVMAAVGWAAWLSTPVAVGTLTAPGSLTPYARAELARDGAIRLVSLRPVAVPAGDSLALWALPDGAREPVLLSAVTEQRMSVAAPLMQGGGIVMVTLEPAAGHKPGAPPGPTVFAGLLTKLGSGPQPVTR